MQSVQRRLRQATATTTGGSLSQAAAPNRVVPPPEDEESEDEESFANPLTPTAIDVEAEEESGEWRVPLL